MKQKTYSEAEDDKEESTLSDSETTTNLKNSSTEPGPSKPKGLVSAPKKHKRGIIYLSTIPRFMNVAKVREIFSQFGEVDRIFLQPEAPSKLCVTF